MAGCALICIPCIAQPNLFSSRWNEAEVDRILVKRWEPYPVYADRNSWESIPRDARNRIISDAELLRGKPYAFLPLAEYLGFVRDGNRDRYEKPYFDRRSQ